MSNPDHDHIENVILWMSYADEDLNLANYAMKMPGSRPYRLIAYHAQQCAEKYVTEDEAHHAVYLASNVKKIIRKVLVDDGMNLEEDTVN